MFVPTIRPHDHHPGPDDGHNSPPFRAAARLQRTCDEHARQEDTTAKLTCARHAGEEPNSLSGGQSHHLSLQNLSARSHNAAQRGLRQVATPIRRRNSDLRTPPGRHGTPACRMAGKRHRGSGGQNHHVLDQLSELPVSADKEGGPEKLPDDARGSRP